MCDSCTYFVSLMIWLLAPFISFNAYCAHTQGCTSTYIISMLLSQYYYSNVKGLRLPAITLIGTGNALLWEQPYSKYKTTAKFF
jgi:hypothetical protein